MKKFIYLIGMASLVLLISGCEKNTMGPNYNNMSRESQPATPVTGQTEDAGGSFLTTGSITVKLVKSPLRFFENGDADLSTIEQGSLDKELPGVYPRYEAVYVDLQGVLIHNANGWTKLQTEAAIYDLATLESKLGATIVNNATAPVGEIDKIRLVLGTNNAVGVAGVNIPLLPEKIDESMTTIDLDASVGLRKTTEIVISFDPYSSVYKEAGNDNADDHIFYLRPIMKVKSINKI